MKNIIQRGVCLLLLLAVTAALSACGQSGAKNTIYAVEAGSAGEEVAKEKGWTVNSVQDQAAALMEVAAGTSDAAVIDLLMAGAMIGPDTSYPNLTYTDSLTEEEYGIGCRQGMEVGGDVESLGRRVTSAVVQAIFAIILIDAAFALLYMEMDI